MQGQSINHCINQSTALGLGLVLHTSPACYLCDFQFCLRYLPLLFLSVKWENNRIRVYMYISIHIHTASYYSYIIEDTACRYLEYFSCSLPVSKHDHYPSGRPSPPSSSVVCSHVQAQVWNQGSPVELRLRGHNQDVSLEARLEHLPGRDRCLSPRILKRSNAVVRHLQNLKKFYFALCRLCITLSIS